MGKGAVPIHGGVGWMGMAAVWLFSYGLLPAYRPGFVILAGFCLKLI